MFHRVIKDFMIQGGGYDTDMTQHETDTITGEFLQNGSFNMIPHERGVISMARTAMSIGQCCRSHVLYYAPRQSVA